MLKSLSLFCLSLILLVSSGFSQQPAQPTKEHEFLKELDGTWDIWVDANNGKPDGQTKYKMVHGDLWLSSDMEMNMGGAKFTGHGLDSYDPVKKKYIAIWVDSMITSPIVMEGDMTTNAGVKTLTMVGKGPGPDGKTTDYKAVTEYKDKNTHIFKLWTGPATDPMMTITYKRSTK